MKISPIEALDTPLLLVNYMFIRGFVESLLCIFSKHQFHRGFLDIVKLSYEFIVSLFTCICSASQHVLCMMIFMSHLHNSLLSDHQLVVKHVFIGYSSVSPRVGVSHIGSI